MEEVMRCARDVARTDGDRESVADLQRALRDYDCDTGGTFLLPEEKLEFDMGVRTLLPLDEPK
jgi:hypothetical protein